MATKDVSISDLETLAKVLPPDLLGQVTFDGIGSISYPDEMSDPIASPPTWSALELVAYANARQWAIATGGRIVTIAGASRPFKTDPESLALINGKAYRLSLPDAPATVMWQFEPSVLVEIHATDFIAAAKTIADWFQATFDALPAIFAGIADGSITTTAQIDAALLAVQ